MIQSRNNPASFTLPIALGLPAKMEVLHKADQPAISIKSQGDLGQRACGERSQCTKRDAYAAIDSAAAAALDFLT
jgi:hypothetical protein